MKKLGKLEEQVFSLNDIAENLMEILCVVGGLPTMDDKGNNTFPKKLWVMEVISEASMKLMKVAELVETVSSEIQDVGRTD